MRPTQWRAIASVPDVIGMGCKRINIEIIDDVPVNMVNFIYGQPFKIQKDSGILRHGRLLSEWIFFGSKGGYREPDTASISLVSKLFIWGSIFGSSSRYFFQAVAAPARSPNSILRTVPLLK